MTEAEADEAPSGYARYCIEHRIPLEDAHDVYCPMGHLSQRAATGPARRGQQGDAELAWMRCRAVELGIREGGKVGRPPEKP